MIDAIKRLRNRDGSPTKASARASGRSICCGAPGAASISVRDGRSASFRLAGRQAQATDQLLGNGNRDGGGGDGVRAKLFIRGTDVSNPASPQSAVEISCRIKKEARGSGRGRSGPGREGSPMAVDEDVAEGIRAILAGTESV